MPRSTNLRAKNLLLTYPKNNTKKETCLENIKKHYKNKLKYAIVSEELHKAGDKHLHVFISLNVNGLRNYHDDLDLFAGKHGNYKAAGSIPKSVAYVIKDGDYVTFPPNLDCKGLIEAGKKKTSAKSVLVAMKIQEGSSDKEIALDPELCGYFLEKAPKINAYRSFLQSLKYEANLKPFFIPQVNGFDNPIDSQIAGWLQKNIRQKRPQRQKQLWLHGSTRMGKSTLVSNLAKMLNTYFFPTWTFPYQEGYNDSFELVVFEEFSGGVPITFMNQFVEGQIMTLNVKNSSYRKLKNMPVIVLSNLSIDEVYHKVKETSYKKFEAFKDRFREIYVAKPIDLYYNHDFEAANQDSAEDSEEDNQPKSKEDSEEESDSEESTSENDDDDDPVTKETPPQELSEADSNTAFHCYEVLDLSDDDNDDDMPDWIPRHNLKRNHAVAFKAPEPVFKTANELHAFQTINKGKNKKKKPNNNN